MPNVFDKISTTLEENAIDVFINVQAGGLGTIQFGFRDFKNNAKAELDSFVNDLSNVPLPQSAHAADLETSFNALLDALPDDVSGLSVTIGDETEAVISHIQNVYIAPLSAFFELYRCIDEMILSFPDLALSGAGGSPGPGGRPAASIDFVLSPALMERLQALGDAFDELTAPLNGVSGLMAVAVVISYLPRQFFSTSQLAYLDEIQQTIETLVAWANNPNNIPAWLEDALLKVDSFIGDCFNDPDLINLIDTAEQAAIDFNNLYTTHNPKPDIEDIIPALDQLAIGINSGPSDIALIDAALAILTPTKAADLKAKLQAISTDFFDGTTDEDFAETMDSLLEKLEEKLLVILKQFSPAFETDLSIQWPDIFPPQDIHLELDNVLDAIRQGLRGLCSLLEKLNLETIAQDLADDAADFESDVQSWRDLLEGFFDQVDTELVAINGHIGDIQTDMAALFSDLQAELEAYTQTITAEVTQILTLIETAIDDFEQLAEDTAGSYTYEDLEESLNEFMQSVSEALMEFADDLERLQKNLQKVVEEIETFSFKTVSDLVVDLIDEATEKLEGIDKDKVNDGLLLGLTAALAVIPTEEQLREKMDLLQEKMEELIDSGPAALLERIKDKPAEILDELKKRSPVPLIKEKLSAFYDEIVETLDEFQPSNLLLPLKAKLEEIQQAIDGTANPCHQLDAIIDVHKDLMEAYDRLEPEKVAQFLEEKQAQVAAALGEAIPEALLNDIIVRLEDMAGTPQALIDLLNKVCAIIDNYTLNPETLIDIWLDDVNIAIDNLPNITALDNLIQGINLKIDLFKNDEIDLKLKTNIFASLGLLEVLADPQDPDIGLVPELLHAYNGLSSIHPSKINALPEPQRSKVLLVLENFNPYKPEIEHDLTALQGLLERIRGYDEKLEEFIEVLLSPDSPIYKCIPVSANIKQALKDCIVKEFKEPLLQLIEWLDPLNEFLGQLKVEVTTFLNCLPDVSAMAQALQDITDALTDIQDIVANTNISPADTLVDNYEQIRSLLDSLVPEDETQGLPGLKNQICESFDQFKASLQLSALLGQDDIDSLDGSFQNLMDVAAQFDPVLWAEESLKQEYERLLDPFLEDFDLTQIFYAMLEKLAQLKEELKKELDRIYDEFIEMLEAVPRLESPAEVQINL